MILTFLLHLSWAGAYQLGNAGLCVASLERVADPAQHGFDAAVDIGSYDPAEMRWKVYDELISEDEKPIVIDALAGLAETLRPSYEEAAVSGRPYIDMFHTITHLARQEMSERLVENDLALNLLNKNKAIMLQQDEFNGIQDIVIDDSTKLYFVITLYEAVMHALTEEGVDVQRGITEVLQIVYDGARIEGAGHRREPLLLPVGHTDPFNHDIWAHKDTIEPQDWAAISDIPAKLHSYQLAGGDLLVGNEAFMVNSCAVASNLPTNVMPYEV